MLNQDGILLSLPGDAVDSTLPQRSLTPPEWNATEIKRIEIQWTPEPDVNPYFLKIYSNGSLELVDPSEQLVFAISYIENKYYVHPEVDMLEDSINFLYVSLLAISRYIARYQSIDEADLGFTNINQAMAAVERLELTQGALSQAQDELVRRDAVIKELENRLKAAESELEFRREEDGIFELDISDGTELELDDDPKTLQDTKKRHRELSSEKEDPSGDPIRVIFSLRDADS